jgi:hypothetical protein
MELAVEAFRDGIQSVSFRDGIQSVFGKSLSFHAIL